MEDGMRILCFISNFETYPKTYERLFWCIPYVQLYIVQLIEDKNYILHSTVEIQSEVTYMQSEQTWTYQAEPREAESS